MGKSEEELGGNKEVFGEIKRTVARKVGRRKVTEWEK